MHTFFFTDNLYMRLFFEDLVILAILAIIRYCKYHRRMHDYTETRTVTFKFYSVWVYIFKILIGLKI